MIYRNLRFALNSAWQSFWRNLAVSTAAVLSITLILILAGINLLVGHAFSQVLDGFRAKVSEISVNVADGTPLQTVYDFQQQLAADPRVTSVKFITKDEALAQFKADPNNVVLAQQISGNPLDAKLEVHLARLDDVAAIDTIARRWSGVDPTDPTNYQGDFVNRMLQLSAWLGVAGVGLLAILVVVSIVIVMNTIRTAVYHRRKEIVDALKCAGKLFGLLRAGGVADDDRKISIIAGRARVAFDAPVGVDTGQDQHLEALARQFQRQLRPDKGGLEREFVEFEIARLHQCAQFRDEFVVGILLLFHEIQSLCPAFILHLVEFRLRIVFAEYRVADPAERLEVRCLARSLGGFHRRGQAAALPMFFTSLRAPWLIKRIVLADRSKRRRFLQNFREIEFLPLRRKFRNGLQFVAG